MSTLLLRLAGPLQSWGLEAKFNRRTTDRVPSKSGVLGLVAAALGRKRNEGLEYFQGLRFGVRLDQEGTLVRDYHTAHEEAFWRNHDGKFSHVTTRYYLADAVFVAALQGDETVLEEVHFALCNPVFPLYLGRRSCPPDGRLSLGIRGSKSLLEALKEEPWQGSMRSHRSKGISRLRVLLDADQNERSDILQRDVPLSFDPAHRKYGFRRIVEHSAPLVLANPETQHDPMLELMGD